MTGTFARGQLAWCLLALGTLLAACAGPQHALAPTTATASLAQNALVLAARPQLSGGRRADVLRALGVEPAAAIDLVKATRGAAQDVTLRRDDGRLITVVAPGGTRLTPGGTWRLPLGADP